MSPLSIWVKLGIVGLIIGGILLAAERLYDNGYDAGVAHDQLALKTAQDAEKVAEDKLRSNIAAQAGKENAGIDARLKQIQATQGKLMSEYENNKLLNPLPSDCLFNKVRVDETNRALNQ